MAEFTLTMHRASEGDALALAWGDGPRTRRALVDLGRTRDYRALKPRLAADGPFELFVITHIDADHIEGAVPLFAEEQLPFAARRIWFNGREQLERAQERLPPGSRVVMGAVQAEKVTAGILAHGMAWNTDFASRVVSVGSPEAAGPLQLDGGLSVTLLSPTDHDLAELMPVWNRELAKAGLRTTDEAAVEKALANRVFMGKPDVDLLAAVPFKEDSAAPNGASIAFIAEYGGRRVLMAADAHPGVMEASLRRLGASETNRMRIDCMKVSHHGSKANTSPSLLSIVDCTRFAISTDGTRHGHPDPELIARLLKADPTRPKRLFFNVRQEKALLWDDMDLKRRWNYECFFSATGSEGLEIAI